MSNKIKSWVYERFLSGFFNQMKKTVIEESNRLTSKLSFDYYWDRTLNCKECGISSDRLCEEEVIVSLTSFGDRIHDVHLAIESIMQQTIKPNRIILWLDESEFKGKALPVALKKQQERGLTIAYCEDLKAYKKLIPSLQLFPNACIITIDDDVAYNPDVIEKFVYSHIENPSNICAGRIRGIALRKDGTPLPYQDWKLCLEKCPEKNELAFFIGVGGVLYPPHCFSDEVLNKDVFMNLCPTADDVWFNAMRLLNGVKVTKVFSATPQGDFTELPSSSLNPLWSYNWFNGGNDEALSAVFSRYGLSRVMDL
jgi:hypothetical protein